MQGSATAVINKAPEEVFALISDITRTGEWSPECTGGRWIGEATVPGIGAKFEGDNALKIAGVTLKKWTTTSAVTAYEPGKVFEFLAEEYTTWRYEIEAVDGGSLVTESFAFETKKAWEKFLYTTLLRRHVGMVKGMQKTLDAMKASLER